MGREAVLFLGAGKYRLAEVHQVGHSHRMEDTAHRWAADMPFLWTALSW